METESSSKVAYWRLGPKGKDQGTGILVLPAWLTGSKVKPQAESQEMRLGWAKCGESGVNSVPFPGWQ